ncbi:hypothetical protein URH17368_2599 [Alicyclobacillus hesperidum URH17-3-68]|uniref:hypothetical protein n=1 Tax=Alicyclobacillus hesperidum TaxID=89784 RepID=UPI000281C3B7|nr:hypothetical protein [Alicyclobacillus hesperidum]EJY54757.1 hypothetical protein URH17368_2599 [Alicyclobacillus hesperidum URH17-3-68]
MLTFKRAFTWVMTTDANTAEENTNRGLWWLVGIIAVTLIAGIAYFMIGHLLTQAQSGVAGTSTSLSSQSGLTQLAQQAESGTLQVGTSSVGSGGYKAP